MACKAAKAILGELAVVTAGAIASGFLMGKGDGFLDAMKQVFTKSGLLFTSIGMGTTYAMTSYQQHVMRGNEAYTDNKIYQRMNDVEESEKIYLLLAEN